MSRTHRRKRVFADLKVQGGLCLRVAVYWLACQASLVLTVLAFIQLQGGTAESPWDFLLPGLVASGVVLPLALLDLVVFSNRFAGPWYRFRKQFTRLADGQAVDPLSFRPRDMCDDLSVNFNRLRDRVTHDQSPADGHPASRETEEEEGALAVH